MTDRTYIAANAEATSALRELLGSLTDVDLAADIGEGWTASMALAHLAYWDAWHLARWQHAALNGLSAPLADAHAISDRSNDALVPTWRALPPAAAVTLCLDAATAVDAHVADLSDASIADARADGGSRWFERAPHRWDHIEQIRRALGRA